MAGVLIGLIAFWLLVIVIGRMFALWSQRRDKGVSGVRPRANRADQATNGASPATNGASSATDQAPAGVGSPDSVARRPQSAC